MRLGREEVVQRPAELVPRGEVDEAVAGVEGGEGEGRREGRGRGGGRGQDLVDVGGERGGCVVGGGVGVGGHGEVRWRVVSWEERRAVSCELRVRG